MDKVINAFLRKEPFALKTSNTDGYKLFFDDTCVGQWKKHSVLISNSHYNNKEMNKFILRLQELTKKSYIIFTLCSQEIPINTKSLRNYE